MSRARVLVAAALVRQGDLVLMSQRRADQSLPLCWEFPGGKIEPGESPEAALRREIAEELGCQVDVGRIEDVVFFAYEDFDLYMLVYVCAITLGVPRAIEVADVEWVDRRRILERKIPPADVPLARRLGQG
jgi:8-oxo-dGTP diphosphatase